MTILAKYVPVSVYAVKDPTRTTALRDAFSVAMKKRFRELRLAIVTSIIKNDCFGLQPGIHVHQITPVGWQAFAFKTSQEKVTKFMQWLETQVKAGILSINEYEQIGTAIDSAWTNIYILDSYKRGIIRARYEMIKAGFNVPSIDATGGIAMALSTPFHADRLGLLYTRVYTDLKGITEQMDSYISRILTQGMADGDGPVLLARKLVSVINGQGIGDLGITDSLGRFIPAEVRAEMLARTEIIRAHHMAMIQEYRNWGALNIIVQAEVVTAGDERVCSICEGLAKNGPYTLDQAEKLIPAHTRCRCVALPVFIK